MTFLAKFPTTTNLTGGLVDFIEWTAIEVDLGVVIASLPSLHALFRRLRPKSNKTRTNAYGYSSSGPQSTPGTGKWSNGGIHFSQKVDQFVELRDMTSETDLKVPQSQMYSKSSSPPQTGKYAPQRPDRETSPEPLRNGPLQVQNKTTSNNDPFNPEGYTHYTEAWR